MGTNHYSIIMQWDPKEDHFVAWVPEFPEWKTHGKTYEEATKNLLAIVDECVEKAQKSEETLPPARIYTDPAAEQDRQ